MCKSEECMLRDYRMQFAVDSGTPYLPPSLRALSDKSENWEKFDHRQSEALVLLRQMLTLHSDGLLLSAEQAGNHEGG